MLVEIINTSLHINGATVEIAEWVSNFTLHFNGCNYVSIQGLNMVYVGRKGSMEYSFIVALFVYILVVGSNFMASPSRLSDAYM